MRKFIFAGCVCIFLLVVICTAGCVGSSDPIVGTWGYQKSTLDEFSKEPGSIIFSNHPPMDQYTYASAYRLVFEPDGTGKDYWEDEDLSDYESEFVWERYSDGSYKTRDIGCTYYTYYNLLDPEQILCTDWGGKYEKYY